MNLPPLPVGIDAEAVLKRLEAARDQRKRENQLRHYRPYAKQREFHDRGARHRERLFMAGNQLGKTLAGGSEIAMHLTGEYPAWWTGKRFDHAITVWAGGVTAEATRDGCQRIMLGRIGHLGEGTIPKRSIVGQPLSRQGVADAMALCRVQHISGAVSTLILKSYDQGREKWQSDTIDVLWCDEEPPEDIYSEGLTRTNAGDNGKGGIVMVTFTPLLGMSAVVKRFVLEKNDDRSVTTMTIEDAEHYTPEQRKSIIASYPEHERKARTLGIPMLGSGAIFPVPEDRVSFQLRQFPRHWKRLAAMDFGWDHPTAIVWITYDADTDTVYVTDAYRVRQTVIPVHASAIKAKGKRVPMAWPQDGLKRDPKGGKQYAQLYREEGVAMLPEPARYMDDRGNSVEAGCADMLTRMETGRLKVASHLADWWEEFRLYHREDGVIVKEGDDLMDATRYAIMSLRFARAEEPTTDRYARSGSGSSSAWAA